MSDTSFPPAAPQSDARRSLPWVLLLFVGSGCAALIYEIVWFQMLQLVIGSTAVSLGVLLATFMGGMCLGSLLLPCLLSAKRRPLRVYAALECCIGIAGLAVLFGMPLVEHVYLAGAKPGMFSILLRAGVCVVCLLPPTLLMGATLPAISRRLQTTPLGVSWLGFFYGGNLAGAVFGCLLAGFYLLRVHDMNIATYVAVLINFSIALLGLGLDVQLPGEESTAEKEAADVTAPAESSVPLRDQSFVYWTIALSGMSALGAEVVWTRLLSLLLGGTVYAFSVILAVFLIGLGLGSSIGSWWGRTAKNPRFALGCCQLLLAVAIAWSVYMITDSLPYWPVDVGITITPNVESAVQPWFNFQLDLVRCLWAVLPPTLFWGASFPLALAAAATRKQDPGKLVGGVYAANTVGAILGSLWFSLVIIPHFGTQAAERWLIGIALAAAMLMLLPCLRARREAQSAEGKPFTFPLFVRALALLAAVGIVSLLGWKTDKIPDGVIAYGRSLLKNLPLPEFLYVGEGLNSSVAVSQASDGSLNFHVSGKIEASTLPLDMRLQRMLGHIPAVLQPNPQSVLIVGCGAGVTAGTFTQYPTIKRIVICEIEPLIPQFVTPFFGDFNYHIVDGIGLQNPRTLHTASGDKELEVVYDDGRHFMLTTKEKFDIITSDPIHPWVKGSAVLYTQEYFRLCKEHLNPGGMVTQWIPFYESTIPTVQSELKTFFSVFPEATLWSNDQAGDGYDSVVLGEANPAPINVDEVQARLDRKEFGWAAASLADVNFHSALDLFKTYAGSASDLQTWVLNAPINRDRDLRLQYLAGFGSNLYLEKQIYSQIKDARTYPDALFQGSPENIAALQAVLKPKPAITIQSLNQALGGAGN
jgi:spermidine synthase